MNRSTLAAALMLIGMALIAIGPSALGWLPTETYWTDADEQAFQKAATELHSASYGGAHDHSQPHVPQPPTDAASQARLEALRQHYAEQEARLKAAQSSRAWLRIAVRGVGVLLAAGGVLHYLQARRAEA